jgi:hypothetical protein
MGPDEEASMTAPVKQSFGFIRALESLVSRSRLSAFLGKGFAGARDYYSVFGYQPDILYNDMLAKYARQGIAARVVDAPAQGIWDNPPTVTSNDPAWDAAWNRIVVKNNLWETLLRLDKLSGLGRYATLFVGINDSVPPSKPARLRSSTSAAALNEVLYLQVYSQETAQIGAFVTDPASPRYMLPDFYTVYPFKAAENTQATPSTSAPAFRVHSSRVVHVAENALENTVYGAPRLERVFNDLDDLVKVSGGSAEGFWMTANRGMQVDIDKDMDLDADDAKNLSDELDEYMHQLRRVIRTRGVKINNLGSDVPNPEQTFKMLISMISGATGIPQRILIGAEAGQLASEQDRANWAERIEARRLEFAEPQVIYPLITRLTHLNVLPSSPDLTITVTWPEAYRLSPLERAQKNAQHARSATNFAAAIDKLVKLKQGTPGVAQSMDAEGKPIPGTGQDAVVGEDYTEILNVDWIKTMLGQDPVKPQLDDPGDLGA